jgi:hypothetical protein
MNGIMSSIGSCKRCLMDSRNRWLVKVVVGANGIACRNLPEGESMRDSM